jgi:hypothetical protein
VESTEEQVTFRLWDPVAGEDLWNLELPAGTIWAPFDQRDLGFLQPNGHLSIRQGLTGAPLFETSLPPDLKIQSMRVLNLEKHWLVLTSTLSPEAGVDRRIVPEPLESVFLTNGPVLCIDRATRQPVWNKVLENSQVRLDYPTRWPVLIFSERKTPPPNPGGLQPFFGYTSDVVALQRETGEEIARVTCTEQPPDRWQAQITPALEILYRKGPRVLTFTPTEQAPKAPE